eukprot:scaffold64328_cov61-Cyclotella_meneghiniana.AAC.1
MMQSDHSGGGSSSNNNSPSLTPDQKIKQDLSTLTEQINLCQSMLTSCPTPSSIDANESLLSVIGFLEACVPRMVELIEAAATGALAEEIFEECLVVNDRLTNVLADVNKDVKDRTTPAATSVAAAPVTSAGEQEINLETTNNIMLDNLNIEDTKTSAVGKTEETTTSSSPMDLLAPTPPPADDPFSILDDGDVDAKPSSSLGKEDEDDFDSFFKDRTSAQHGGKDD